MRSGDHKGIPYHAKGDGLTYSRQHIAKVVMEEVQMTNGIDKGLARTSQHIRPAGYSAPRVILSIVQSADSSPINRRAVSATVGTVITCDERLLRLKRRVTWDIGSGLVSP